MKIDHLLDILLILYICFSTLALVKPIGIYNLLDLRRLRNFLILTEGFFILATLTIVKLEYMRSEYILFAIILGSATAMGGFVDKLKKNLKDDVYVPQWIDRLNNIWHKGVRQIMYVGIIVFCIALYPPVYSTFHKDEFSIGDYRNIIMSSAVLTALIGGALYLLLIILAEKKYGPIYNIKNKKDDSLEFGK